MFNDLAHAHNIEPTIIRDKIAVQIDVNKGYVTQTEVIGGKISRIQIVKSLVTESQKQCSQKNTLFERQVEISSSFMKLKYFNSRAESNSILISVFS